MSGYAEFGNGWRCACGCSHAREWMVCTSCGRGRSAEAQALDPRVEHGDGPHPNLVGVTALVESVHERLDALGVPRTVEAVGQGLRPELATLTLLGRMDALLNPARAGAPEVSDRGRDHQRSGDVVSRRDDATVRAAVRHYIDVGLRTERDYAELPGVRGVEVDRRELRVTLYVDGAMTEGARQHLQADVEARREMNVLVAWKTCRRKVERRRTGGGLPPIPSDARWE